MPKLSLELTRNAKQKQLRIVNMGFELTRNVEIEP
jgi:hypothetical protein